MSISIYLVFQIGMLNRYLMPNSNEMGEASFTGYVKTLTVSLKSSVAFYTIKQLA